MWMMPSSMRIYVCRKPADMRRSFDGLSGMTRDIFLQEPTNGHLFVFFNRRGDRVKVLYFDRSGLAIWYKRLEAGHFHLPEGEEEVLEMAPADFSCVLEGIDLENVKRRKRFSLPR